MKFVFSSVVLNALSAADKDEPVAMSLQISLVALKENNRKYICYTICNLITTDFKNKRVRREGPSHVEFITTSVMPHTNRQQLRVAFANLQVTL